MSNGQPKHNHVYRYKGHIIVLKRDGFGYRAKCLNDSVQKALQGIYFTSIINAVSIIRKKV